MAALNRDSSVTSVPYELLNPPSSIRSSSTRVGPQALRYPLSDGEGRAGKIAPEIITTIIKRLLPWVMRFCNCQAVCQAVCRGCVPGNACRVWTSFLSPL